MAMFGDPQRTKLEDAVISARLGIADTVDEIVDRVSPKRVAQRTTARATGVLADGLAAAATTIRKVVAGRERR